MKRNWILAPVFWLLIGLLGAGCITPGKEVESLDPARCGPDEGLVVVRFLTERADKDDLDHPERDPDISYGVSVGTSKSVFLKAFGAKGTFDVDAKHGPALIVRQMDAGDYYFNELQASGGSAPIAVKFSVQPGRVTYIGDLEILFIASKGFLGMTNLSCAFKVSTDSTAVMSELRSRFPVVPAVDTVPMVVEDPSL